MLSQRRIRNLPAAFDTFALVAALAGAVTACEEPLPTEAPGEPRLPPPKAFLHSARELGSPLPFLNAYEARLFEQGSATFQMVFTPATGLGPLFNGRSCADCHEDPVVGGVGDEVETHATAYTGGVCDDLSAYGGPVFEDSVTPALHDALGIDRDPVPAEATAIAHRTTPSVLGFGLLDAVPDAEILALADPFDRNGDGISGRPNRTVDGRLGRFGRKAQIATLREFVEGAFHEEMGITDPAQPSEKTVADEVYPAGIDPALDPEIDQQQLDATVAFSRFLAPPEPLPRGLVEDLGGLVFLKLGCAGCHVPALVTGPSPVRALSFKVVYAYTDLLLHDMGPELADICLGLAKPSDFRTEPMMGLRFKSAFLHDGRASTIAEAIALHGGEGAASRDRFLGLSSLERFLLLRFLQGL